VGYHIIEPAEGFLACGYEGKGRLPEAEVILEEINRILKEKDLKGEKLLITAGPNREPIDPVRYISNRSSGKMGYALARAAILRGAEVTLVTGPTALEPPFGARVIAVITAEEMRAVVLKEIDSSSVVVMAAAVSDYRPVTSAGKKLKRGKEAIELRLEPNPDILKELGAKKDGKILIGFAAETEDLIANAAKKLLEKNLDMIVANNVAEPNSGFDGDTNIATIMDRAGTVRSLPLMSKDELADQIFDHFLALKSQR
jgi:phosphopantothenoylcysteine decarboxylase/phosphopantothenate--cysteine ligase